MAGKHSILKTKSVQTPSSILSDENVTGIRPNRKQMLLPKMLSYQRLPRRALDQAPARLCAPFEATRWQYTSTFSHFSGGTAATKTPKRLRDSLFLLISQPYPEGRHGVMDLSKATY